MEYITAFYKTNKEVNQIWRRNGLDHCRRMDKFMQIFYKHSQTNIYLAFFSNTVLI